MSTYTIRLADGAVLNGLTLNGGMFVSRTEITKAALNQEVLSEVEITEHFTDGTKEVRILENQVCDAVLHWEEGWLFNLRDMTESEILEGAIVELAEIVGGVV